MAKFESKTRFLILQDEDGVWAEFVDGKFATNDKSVIARLKDVKGVSQVGKPDSQEPDGDKQAEPTVAELRALAAEKGIDLGDAKKKADILAVIEAAESSDNDDDN